MVIVQTPNKITALYTIIIFTMGLFHSYTISTSLQSMPAYNAAWDITRIK